ncbi:MAG: penicillin-binding protein 2 [Chthoniobacteraceae bacterium]
MVFRSIFPSFRLFLAPLLAGGLSALAQDQQITALTQPVAPAAAPDSTPLLKPTWETQKHAGTVILTVPAPRGQIVDRNGQPLAQTRVSYNLAITFPAPLNFSDSEVLTYTRTQLQLAASLLNRQISLDAAPVLKFYHDRGMMPLDIAQDLQPSEIALIRKQAAPGLVLNPVYLRFYPNGRLAAHLLGYVGKTGKTGTGPIQDNDLLWPDIEGREGLEQTFNSQLVGKNGQFNMTFDAQGQRTSEKISLPPQPGYNVITTLDLHLQQLCEQALAGGAKRGAIVIMDPNNGDILAMASWPEYNPNDWIPSISPAEYDKLQKDPDVPLLPRAFRSAYPPGSTFKVIVGIAALQSGKISLDDEFSGPAAMTIGNTVMHNWKRTDAGMLNFHEALEQSCDTWFYQVGIKTGSAPIVDWAQRFGFGVKTGIPLKAEADGRVPTDDYMQKVHGRKILNGDIANISIGQGDVLVTPLQMAEAMVAVANGGNRFQSRLVKQVQTIDNRIVTAYPVRVREQLPIDPKISAAVRDAMIDVVSGGGGTAHKAEIDGIQVAGKTGTAQWGPKKKERNAAWFAGFAPAKKPQYAFAAVYEGEIGESTHGGEYAAPLIAKVLKPVFKDQQDAEKAAKKAAKAAAKKSKDADSDSDNSDHSDEKPKPAKDNSDNSSNDESD